MKAIFNVGDDIVLRDFHRGIEGGRVMCIDDEFYYIRILRGTAKMPIKAINENYKLKNLD